MLGGFFLQRSWLWDPNRDSEGNGNPDLHDCKLCENGGLFAKTKAELLAGFTLQTNVSLSDLKEGVLLANFGVEALFFNFELTKLLDVMP